MADHVQVSTAAPTREAAVTLKTTAERYPELEAHLVEAHPWDNPEVSFTPLGGSMATWTG
jgi:periplasmic divalent cation tolerance protein